MDWQTGMGLITPKKREMVDLEGLPLAIERGGFKPMRYEMVLMKIFARGTVEGVGSETRFRFSGWPIAYLLEEVSEALPGACRIEAEVAVAEGVPKLRVIRVMR